MRKRFKIALAVVPLALAGVFSWQAAQPEPVYQGKRLSEWLKDYPSPKIVTSGSFSWLAEDGMEERNKANEAVRQAGTKAIPTLLRMLRARDSALKLKLITLAQKQHLIEIGHTPAQKWNRAAVTGFSLLGTNAHSAVPALIEIADQDISPSSQTAAIQSLGYVGPPAKQAVPSLLLLATNAHWELRSAAVRALGRIHVEPNRVLPVLTNALHDTNVSVQLYAVGALRDFGPNAKLAVPALFEYLSHAASPYRLEIDSALKAIDPQAAAKAGIK